MRNISISTQRAGFLLAFLGALLFTSKGIVAKLLYREGVDATTVMGLRMLLSAPVFALIAAWSWGRKPALTAQDGLKILGLGFVGYYLSSFLSFAGLQYISAGLERLVMFLNPTVVLLMGWVWFKRRINRRQWLSMGFCYLGIVAVFWNDAHVTGDVSVIALGTSLIFASTLTYGVYMLLSGEMVSKYGSLRLVSLAMLASTLFTMTHYALSRPFIELFVQSASVWRLSAINALFCTVFPVTLMMLAIQRLGAGPVSQMGMVGPVATVGLSYWILGEPITGLQVLGTALVIVGIVVLSRQKTNSTDNKNVEA